MAKITSTWSGLIFLSLCFQLGNCLEAVPSKETLPLRRFYSSAVYDGEDGIYILGGDGIDEVVKFRISKEEAQIVAEFPEATCCGAAAGGVYGSFYFGGEVLYTGKSSYIWGFTSSNPAPRPAGNLLQKTVFPSVAEFDGNYYVVGGQDETGAIISNITRFNGYSHEVEDVAFLEPRFGAASVWFNESVYIFGGDPTDREAVQFNPDTGEVATLDSTLPVSVTNAIAVTDGEFIYLVCGTNEAEIIRFNPTTYEIERLPVSNYRRLRGCGATYVGKNHRIYVFGGYEGDEQNSNDEILYIDLS